MKKKLNKKLQLNKEIIARLNEDQQSSIQGGVLPPSQCDRCATEASWCICQPPPKNPDKQTNNIVLCVTVYTVISAMGSCMAC